jgi:hypothetical protein
VFDIHQGVATLIAVRKPNNCPDTNSIDKIGHYQVCPKWLDNRRGTALSLDERLTYQQMVAALERTLALQAQIDGIV